MLGPETILAKDPQHRPEKLAKSPAPFVHAASKAARLALYQSYSWFVAAFRKAAEKLRRGDRSVCLEVSQTFGGCGPWASEGTEIEARAR